MPTSVVSHSSHLVVSSGGNSPSAHLPLPPPHVQHISSSHASIFPSFHSSPSARHRSVISTSVRQSSVHQCVSPSSVRARSSRSGRLGPVAGGTGSVRCPAPCVPPSRCRRDSVTACRPARLESRASVTARRAATRRCSSLLAAVRSRCDHDPYSAQRRRRRRRGAVTLPGAPRASLRRRVRRSCVRWLRWCQAGPAAAIGE